jgi:hypothetical protein
VLARLVVFACVLGVSISSGAADLAQMALASQAEACCRAMEGACAGLSAPDDCCRTPQASLQVGTTSTAAKAVAGLIAPLVAPRHFNLESFDRERRFEGSTFTRAHDPPHLHPVALRI